MCNNYPKITILTPCFNAFNYIEETMLSVINQGYPNLEYIVVDGGSTDGTVDIIRKYEKYLSWWTSEPDKGLYDALKKGFAKSTGEIQGWICASDILLPQTLFKVADIFTTFPEVEWITGCATIICDDGKMFTRLNLPPHTRETFLAEGLIQQESTFWRRSLYEKAGGCNPEIKYGGDFELWIRFFRFAKLYYVKTTFGAWRRHESSITYKKKEGEEGWLNVHRQAIDNELKEFPHTSIYYRLLKVYNAVKDIFVLRELWWRVIRKLLYKKFTENLPPVIVYDANEGRWVMRKGVKWCYFW